MRIPHLHKSHRNGDFTTAAHKTGGPPLKLGKNTTQGFRQGSGQKGDDQRASSKVVYPYADVSNGTTSLDASKFSRGEHIGAHPRGGCNSPRMHIACNALLAYRGCNSPLMHRGKLTLSPAYAFCTGRPRCPDSGSHHTHTQAERRDVDASREARKAARHGPATNGMSVPRAGRLRVEAALKR